MACPCTPTTPFFDSFFMSGKCTFGGPVPPGPPALSGSPPAGWYEPDFDASGWTDSQQIGPVCDGLCSFWLTDPPASSSEIVAFRHSSGFPIPSTSCNCVCYQLTSLIIGIQTRGVLLATYFDGAAVTMPEFLGGCSDPNDHIYANYTVPLDTVNTRPRAAAFSSEFCGFPVWITPSNYHTIAFLVQANNPDHAGVMWNVTAEGVCCDYACAAAAGGVGGGYYQLG